MLKQYLDGFKWFNPMSKLDVKNTILLVVEPKHDMFDDYTTMSGEGIPFLFMVASPWRYPSYPLDRWSFPGIGWGSPEKSVLWVYPILDPK